MKTQINALTSPNPNIVRQVISPVEIKNIVTNQVISTFGIWDTGATGSMITQSIAQSIGLIESGYTDVTGVHGTQKVKKYFVNITLNNKNITLNLTVTECLSLSRDNSIGMLIGMDIITLGDFAITNFQGKTILSFRVPSIQPIDFVDGINCSKPIVSTKLQGRNDLCKCGSGKKYKNCHEKRS